MRSYRAATIGLDFATIGLFVYALDNNRDRLLELSVGTYALGAPLIHVLKGRNGSALASLGMRLGLPLLGGIIGKQLNNDPVCDDDGGPVGCAELPHDEVVVGIVFGVLTAMTVDAAYLARSEAPPASPQRTWSPTIRASQGGFALGAVGTF